MTTLQTTCVIDGAEADGENASLSCWSVHGIDVLATPDHIDVGITCGMSEMCGEHPCLCGAADEWGDCACNGYETLEPTITATCSGGPIALVPVKHGWTVISFAPCGADITVSSSLAHYGDAAQTVHVTFGGPSPGSIVALALAISAAAAIIALAMRWTRKKRARRSCAGAEGESAASEELALEADAHSAGREERNR